MPIITLISDWGCKDPYLASVKGTILKQLPETVIVDISHDIPPFDINQASFILKNSYKAFPPKTIHIIAINSEASIETPHTVVEYDEHFFIGADNGIFPLVMDGEPTKIVELEIFQDSDYFTFSSRDVFVKAAIHIANTGKPEDLGTIKTKLNERISFKPVVEENIIRGKVIYIDSFENLITNITEKQFNKIRNGKKFEITFRTPGYVINTICDSYSDVPAGEMLAIFGSTGFLEIAMNKGNASSLLGMDLDEIVRVEFK
ncbi:MAG: SAM-dependent chlorinase/fluorinase [Bacteroidales bacterium]|nr:SAM-dependent chlorinase/fluorinase [Bacteroidales bacterium]